MKTFEATLRDAGNESTYEITIPKRLVEYEGFKPGDILEVSVKKKEAEA